MALREAEEHFERGRYDDALKAWEQVRASFYSPELNTLAEFKIGETYFRAERYAEAVVADEDFLRQHPHHVRNADVMFRLGVAFFRQMLPANRDQTATRSALATFQALGERYPDYPRLNEAAEFISACRNQLANHEFHVGHFYFRTKKYAAAINRLEQALRQYPTFDRRDEASAILARAYQAAGKQP